MKISVKYYYSSNLTVDYVTYLAQNLPVKSVTKIYYMYSYVAPQYSSYKRDITVIYKVKSDKFYRDTYQEVDGIGIKTAISASLDWHSF